MDFQNKKIGIALTGSYCTFGQIFPIIRELMDMRAEVFPIISYAVDSTDTRFYSAGDVKKELALITGKQIIKTIPDAEPIGPKGLLDALIVAPCTSNTLGKIAHGINDTPVTMAVKSQLRNFKPVIISVSTNDGLTASAPNIGLLMNRRNIYFVPYAQDDPIRKQTSIVAKSQMIIPTLIQALEGQQTYPILTV